MYQGSERKISNRTYAIVKKFYPVTKANRTAYRKAMRASRKTDKITSKDADRLYGDYVLDQLIPDFVDNYTVRIRLTIYCCVVDTDDISYRPLPKIFDFIGPQKRLTKEEFLKGIEELLPAIRDIEGDEKCKALSISRLEACTKYKYEVLGKIGKKKVPKKKKAKKKSKKKGAKK